MHEREISFHLPNLSEGVKFIPHVSQWFRGIHLTVSIELDGSLSREDIFYRYRTYYEDEPFVIVTDSIPEVRDVVSTPSIIIGGFALSQDRRRLVLTTVLDNLLKGAASQCIQNANLMLGLQETAGIE